MTKSELKSRVDETGSHFFDHDSMRFFGDSMANYTVSGPKPIVDSRKRCRLVFELARRRPVKNGVKSSAYFDAETFERVFPLDR